MEQGSIEIIVLRRGIHSNLPRKTLFNSCMVSSPQMRAPVLLTLVSGARRYVWLGLMIFQ